MDGLDGRATNSASGRAPLPDPVRRAGKQALELSLILVWALWIGRGFLDLDPGLWPHGRDFALSVEPLYQWDLLGQCGACVLWNGFFNGGAPAFLETHAPFSHPLVVLFALLTDPVATSKLLLVVSLALAGIAQWWLGRVLRLGWFPRLWAALLAVAGGHLAGRMELGLVWMVFSNASAALVLPPLLRLYQQGRRRDAVITGVAMASALLSGQGYAQAALLVVCLTAAALFTFDLPFRIRPIWKEVARAATLAVMLTGILWTPLLNLLPLIAKDVDSRLVLAQDPRLVPADFLVSSVEFHRLEGPGRVPFPGVSAHFIGWLPVALFGLAVVRLPFSRQKRVGAFLTLPVLALGVLASDLVADLVGRPVPSAMGAVRHPTLLLGVAVPLLLGAAAMELDSLIHWAARSLSAIVARPTFRRLVAACGAALVLALSLPEPYRFTLHWMRSFAIPDGAAATADRLVTDGPAWVDPPGEGYWALLLAGRGQKLTVVYRPWWLEGAPLPPASLRAEQIGVDPSMRFDHVIGRVGVQIDPNIHYAAIESATGTTPCTASARGGQIAVTCPESPPGRLIVMELQAPDWHAACNGATVPLAPGDWLSVTGVSGPLECSFSYLPWDVPAGLAFSALGVVAAIALWRSSSSGMPRRGRTRQPPAPRNPSNLSPTPTADQPAIDSRGAAQDVSARSAE